MAANDDLARFNSFLANEAEQEKQARRIKRAEQAKEKAAAEVRRLDGDGRATAEQKAEAKQTYLDAHEAWRREVAGEAPDDPTPADADTESATAGEGEQVADEQVADEQATEAAGEEPPADEAPSEAAAPEAPDSETADSEAAAG